jgi:hypothetical protein
MWACKARRGSSCAKLLRMGLVQAGDRDSCPMSWCGSAATRRLRIRELASSRSNDKLLKREVIKAVLNVNRHHRGKSPAEDCATMIRNCCKKGLLLLLGCLCTGNSIHAVAGEPLSLEQAELTLRALPLPSIVHELVGLPEFPRGRKAFLVLLTREAHQRRLPPELADAVTQIESGYDPTARGSAGEIGLMQVRPSPIWRASALLCLTIVRCRRPPRRPCCSHP